MVIVLQVVVVRLLDVELEGSSETGGVRAVGYGTENVRLLDVELEGSSNTGGVRGDGYGTENV